MTEFSLLLIGGCPRSGTTALQLFLGGHPSIVTTRETHIFDYYIMPVLKRYRDEAEWMHSADGLRAIVSEKEMRAWGRRLATTLFRNVLTNKPHAAIVLEKTPDNTLHATEIANLFPRARFISVVRDPRSVTASFLAAVKEPWGAWAPDTAEEAAKRWLQAIETLPKVDAAFGKRHLCVRYEDFVDPNAGGRKKLAAFLSTQFPKQTFALSQFILPKVGDTLDLGLSDDRANPAKEERRNFFRSGLTEGWRQELSVEDVATIEHICEDGMRKFGYLP